MKPEYKEGIKVAREFEDAIKRIFQTPKPTERKRPKAKEDHEQKSDRD
jgi:hypothetical protein